MFVDRVIKCEKLDKPIDKLKFRINDGDANEKKDANYHIRHKIARRAG